MIVDNNRHKLSKPAESYLDDEFDINTEDILDDKLYKFYYTLAAGVIRHNDPNLLEKILKEIEQRLYDLERGKKKQ